MRQKDSKFEVWGQPEQLSEPCFKMKYTKGGVWPGGESQVWDLTFSGQSWGHMRPTFSIFSWTASSKCCSSLGTQLILELWNFIYYFKKLPISKTLHCFNRPPARAWMPASHLDRHCKPEKRGPSRKSLVPNPGPLTDRTRGTQAYSQFKNDSQGIVLKLS